VQNKSISAVISGFHTQLCTYNLLLIRYVCLLYMFAEKNSAMHKMLQTLKGLQSKVSVK